MLDQVLSFREMCDLENVQVLQRGMNFRMNPPYSIILMSQRHNAPYRDRILPDGQTIEYEGHDAQKAGSKLNPKEVDQPRFTGSGLTQNGMFAQAVDEFKKGARPPELVKAYEKLMSGVWSLKGVFDLVDYRIENDGHRNVFIFVLRLSAKQDINISSASEHPHTRLIPSEVKKEVWKRDKGRCVICGADKNLHFDHDLPFSKGGTSITAANIRLLCARHNLAKSDKIE
jgi:hypothetical protein